ncbi:MAG: iron-containing alcohol dehydrogenase family protein [Elusimicrobiota bacterium]|jgi:glycerol-1-phosphate dehydrogenase [NAD(P)+]|nr:iron-containing alcohol dehydrogenase family protein [Elusimicrobiota bacterium]
MDKSKEINIPSLLKIGGGKMQKIGKYLVDRKFMKAALFFSDGIEPLVSAKLYEGFKQHNIEIAHKDTINDINIENILHTAFKIPSDINVLIGIGGGKALDFSKYCAHALKLPFISAPTSVSNDGFCSPNASLLVEGKRRSVKSTIPYGVVADLDIITGAPQESLYSGLGDIISKVTALWDWKEAFVKKQEDYNDFASLISRNSLDILYSQERDINTYDFQYKLTNSLLLSGIAMEIAGSSRPASGSEHLVSHALDMHATKPRAHGLQVGVATYLCSLLQDNNTTIVREFLLNTGFASFVKDAPLDKTDFITALKFAPSVKPGYYTIWSEPSSLERAIKFLETDEILRELVK